MADIKKIKVGDESYDITASKLEGDVTADQGTFTNYIYVGDMLIRDDTIFRDNSITLSATSDITIDATENYPIKLYGKELLFNDQPVGCGSTSGDSFTTDSGFIFNFSNYGDDDRYLKISDDGEAIGLTINNVAALEFYNEVRFGDTAFIKGEAIATQEWVTAQIQAALNNN